MSDATDPSDGQGSAGRKDLIDAIAKLGHEINTPLGVIATAASSIRANLAELAKLSGPEAREIRADIEEALDFLVRNLARASALAGSLKRLTAGHKAENQRARHDLAVVVKDGLTLMAPDLRLHSITIDQSAVEGPYYWIGDSLLLQQILANFVQNTCRYAFGPEQRNRRIRVAILPAQSGYQVIYADNGRGMSAEVLARIFERGFTTSTDGSGSGLGMAIVKENVESQLGGRIEVKSAAGQGATFTLFLPAGQEVNNG